MKYFSLRADKKSVLNGFLIVAFILVSNTFFAQSVQNVVEANPVEINSSKSKDNVSAVNSSNSLNFVLWFMGSKLDPNKTISTEGTTTKKQVITSGAAPNRVLIKTFLKKAVNLESMVA